MEPHIFHEDCRQSKLVALRKPGRRLTPPSLWGTSLGWGAGLGGLSRSSPFWIMLVVGG